MEEEEGPRWSREALLAMETHLSLLNKATSQCEPDAVGGRLPPQLSEPCEPDIGPLLSHLPLPHGWEQFLDLQTGQVYYIDWKKCRRSYLDPRTYSLEHDISNDSEECECMSDADNWCVSRFDDRTGTSLHINKLPTSPMLQEDWDLMAIRGWMALDCDDHSEITCELKSPCHLTSDYDSLFGENTKGTFLSHECESANVSKVDLGFNKD